MKLLVFYAAIISFAMAGIIQQDSDEGSNHEYHNQHHLDHGTTLHDHHDDRPTSYQNIHIKHYHPVPVFIKKEYKELLEHPVSSGESSSNLEVHHGGKYDHGYAFKDGKQSYGDFGGFDEDLGGSQGDDGGYGNYGSQEHGQYGQFGGQNEGGHYQEGGDSDDDGDGSY